MTLTEESDTLRLAETLQWNAAKRATMITAIWYEISIYLGIGLIIAAIISIAVWRWKAVAAIAVVIVAAICAYWLPMGLNQWRFFRIDGQDKWIIVYSPDLGSNPLVQLRFLKSDRPILAENGISFRNPALSASGLRMAFSMSNASGEEHGGMAIINVDGGGFQRLLPAGVQAEGISWSPDEKHIAFWCGRNAETESMDLCLFDMEGKGSRVLLKKATFYGSPFATSWSPDSKGILFTSIEGDVSIVDRHTRRVMRVARGGAPSWSPDGTTIIYREGIPYSRRPDERLRYFAIGPDGKNKRLVFEGGPQKWDDGQVTQPVVWSPDSRFILFLKTYDPAFDTNFSKVYLLEVASGEKYLVAKKKHIQSCSWSAR